jgi:hypothetical protein
MYAIEIHNKIGKLNGRSCAVGTLYLVRKVGGCTLRANLETRQAAEAWLRLYRAAEESTDHAALTLTTPTEYADACLATYHRPAPFARAL